MFIYAYADVIHVASRFRLIRSVEISFLLLLRLPLDKNKQKKMEKKKEEEGKM
jgi:hypothetical protein